MRELDETHKEILFDRFGINNYRAWEVTQIYEICDAHGWIKPCAYQGIYNSVHRAVEPKLFPCRRHYEMSFYAYSPLGVAFFAGNLRGEREVEKGSRFDPQKLQGRSPTARYWNDVYFGVREKVRPVVEKHGWSLAEVALRWMTYHGQLGKRIQMRS